MVAFAREVAKGGSRSNQYSWEDLQDQVSWESNKLEEDGVMPYGWKVPELEEEEGQMFLQGFALVNDQYCLFVPAKEA